jgi:flavorubredoxin
MVVGRHSVIAEDTQSDLKTDSNDVTVRNNMGSYIEEIVENLVDSSQSVLSAPTMKVSFACEDFPKKKFSPLR